MVEVEILKLAIKINKQTASLRNIKDENGVKVLDDEAEKFLKEAIKILNDILAEY